MNIIKIWISSSFLLRLKQNKATAGKTFVKSDKCNEKNILLGMTQNKYLYKFYLDENRVVLDSDYKNQKSIWFWEKNLQILELC